MICGLEFNRRSGRTGLSFRLGMIRGYDTQDGVLQMIEETTIATADFTKFGKSPRIQVVQKSSNGTFFVDYRDADKLRRFLTPNGKILPRKRTGLSARGQRMVSQAIRRSRYMGLLPYTSATL